MKVLDLTRLIDRLGGKARLSKLFSKMETSNEPSMLRYGTGESDLGYLIPQKLILSGLSYEILGDAFKLSGIRTAKEMTRKRESQEFLAATSAAVEISKSSLKIEADGSCYMELSASTINTLKDNDDNLRVELAEGSDMGRVEISEDLLKTAIGIAVITHL